MAHLNNKCPNLGLPFCASFPNPCPSLLLADVSVTVVKVYIYKKNALKGFHGKHVFKDKIKHGGGGGGNVAAAKEGFTCCLAPVKSGPASGAY